VFSAGCGESSDSISSSSSPYSNVSLALKDCQKKYKVDVANGVYDQLSDARKMTEGEAAIELCMSGYGHYPQ